MPSLIPIIPQQATFVNAGELREAVGDFMSAWRGWAAVSPATDQISFPFNALLRYNFATKVMHIVKAK